MYRLGHGWRIVFLIFIAAGIVPMGGCGWWVGEPERRASAFVETLVREPTQFETLQGFMAQTPGVDVLAFTNEPPMRVALEYLRAKHRGGTGLDFSAFETARPNMDSRRIAVRVRVGDARPANDEVVLLLDLERESGGVWLVTQASVMP